MKRLFKILTIAAIMLLLALSLLACAPEAHVCPPHVDEDSDGICDECKKVSARLDLSGVTMPDAEYFYDATAHSLELLGSLPEGVTVSYDGNGKTEVGTYTVTAKLYYKNVYLEGSDIKATLSIKPLSELAIPDVSMSSKEFTYDGEEHSLAILGILPEGVTVKYEGNGKVNAGDYTVTAKFYYKDLYIEGRDIQAHLSIDKRDLTPEIEKLGFSDVAVTYDGLAHSILVEGDVPSVVELNYEGNGASKIGEYTVYAKFTLKDTENYLLSVTELEAKLKITDPIAAAGITFSGKKVVYDGGEHNLAILGTLPKEITVDYDGNGKTNAGEYTVTARFFYNGEYIEGCDMTAKLVIDKRDLTPEMEKLGFSDVAVTYDGLAHSILVEGDVPSVVELKYEGNGVSKIGEYTVYAKFTLNDTENYLLSVTELEAKLKITDPIAAAGITFSGKKVVYDGGEHNLAILGTLPKEITVDYDGNGKTNAGEYTVTARFYYNGEYIEGCDMTAKLVIDKRDLTPEIEKLGFSDVAVTYDGLAHSILVEGDVPSAVELNYEGNGVSKIGEYTVYAKFTLKDTENYLLSVTELEAKLVITNPVTAAGITFPDKEVVYNGATHSLELVGLDKLPANITFNNYENNGQKNAGTYSVLAQFAVNGVHDPALDLTATLKIKQATIEVGLENEYLEKVFDNKVVELPELVWGNTNKADITLTVQGAGEFKYPGTYTVRYSFLPVAGLEDNYKPKDDVVLTVKIAHDPTLAATEGLQFEYVGDHYRVVGYDGTSPIVIIPSKYSDGVVEAPVTAVAKNSFESMAIEYVYIPDTVDFIGPEAFSGCTALVSVRMTENLISLGSAAFRGTSIHELILPDTVRSIGYAALEGTESLESIRIPFVGGGVNTAHDFFGYILGATLYTANDDYVPASLRTIIVGRGSTKIPEHAFFGLSGVTSITLSDGIVEIGNRAFAGCSALTDIYIPSSVTKIPANAAESNSPFFGCDEDLMLVFGAACVYGDYFNYVSNEKRALAIYGKSYEDYLMNKDEYRKVNQTDATLAGITRNDLLIEGFRPDVTEYEIDVDIATGYGEFAAFLNSPAALILNIEYPTSLNGGKFIVTVQSGDGKTKTTYTVLCHVVGSFDSSSEITVKGGAEGTVVYVVDDGYQKTGEYCKKKLSEIANLAISFAIKSEKFATLNTVTGEDGITRYVMDSDGKYTYTITNENQSTIDFWRDVLDSAKGRSEIVSHTHTHAPWGYDDKGGHYIYTNGGKAAIKLGTEGTLSKEIFASRQIMMDVLGQPGLAMVTAGINQNGGDVTLAADYVKTMASAILRLETDALVNCAGTTITLSSDTQMLLNPVVVTIPQGTQITTTADIVDGKILKGSVVTVLNVTITVPAGTVIKGYNTNYYGLHKDAIEDGLLIGSRLTGGGSYVASQFANNVDLRMKLKSYMIVSSTSNDASVADTWIGYIDKGLANGAITAFCIHAIVDDVNADNGQGGHEISKAQADKLFAYTESLGDRVWVATLTDAMLYYYEWSTATVSSKYENNSITVSLTDNEKDEVYTMPLTVKVSVPAIWDAAVTDKGVELEVQKNDDGTRYVLVDVAPESSVVISAK